MFIPQSTLKVFEMTQLDRMIDWYANLEKPCAEDLQRVMVEADVQCQLDKFRTKALNMNSGQLEKERHYSRRLGKNMERAHSPRPHDACEAHAIVSGGHKDAAVARAILARYKRELMTQEMAVGYPISLKTGQRCLSG
ncbi:MAG: hypothetical protein ACR2PX_17555 [Endozoicomonas sp.]|uniref:hypothetical protein n=1 Tax=Endozoicomonas sp. TaxID=1892382 RepID=UPI003D9AF023